MSIGGAPAVVGGLLEELSPTEPQQPGSRRWRRVRMKPWRLSILILALVFYLVPLLSSIKFSLLDQTGGYGFGNYTAILHSSALLDSLYLSLEIAGLTAVLVILLVFPTVVLVRLKLPKMVIVMDVITILPIVVPPIVLAAGLDEMSPRAPAWVITVFFNHPRMTLVPIYTMMAMPLVYRAIDNGVRSIDLHTLVDAARSIGCSWPSTLLRVILPNVQTAVLGAMFLTIAMSLGEVVISNQMGYNTFPVQMLLLAQAQNTPGISVALTLVSLLFTFALLFSLTFLARRHGRTSTR